MIKTNKKIDIRHVDMPASEQIHAINIIVNAFSNNDLERNIAACIKKEFDEKYGPFWHCVVGKNFGAFVSHENPHFIYVYIDQTAVLLYKTSNQIIECIDSEANYNNRPVTPIEPAFIKPIMKDVK